MKAIKSRGSKHLAVEKQSVIHERVGIVKKIKMLIIKIFR